MNYYSTTSADQPLKTGTKEEAEQLSELLTNSMCGLDADFVEGDGLFVYGDESFAEDEIPDEALKLIGEIIKRDELEYLDFGVSFHADRVLPGSCGGMKFRIFADGDIIFEDKVWYDPRKLLGAAKGVYLLLNQLTHDGVLKNSTLPADAINEPIRRERGVLQYSEYGVPLTNVVPMFRETEMASDQDLLIP